MTLSTSEFETLKNQLSTQKKQLSSSEFASLKAQLSVGQRPSFIERAGEFGRELLRSGLSSAVRGVVETQPALQALDPTRRLRRQVIPERIETPIGEITPRFAEEPREALVQAGETLLDVAPGGTFTRPLRRAFQRQAGRTSSKLINKVIRPLSKEFQFGKNPGRAVADEGIVANTVDELAPRIGEVKRDIGEQIGAAFDVPDIARQKLRLGNVVRPLEKAIKEQSAIGRTKQPVVNRLKTALDDIQNLTDIDPGTGEIISIGKRNLDNLTPRQGHELRQLVGDITIWEGTAADKPVNVALQKVYRNINKVLESRIPSLRGLSSRYANLLTAESAAKRSIAREERAALIGLGQTSRSLGVAMIAAVLSGGRAVPAILAGAGESVIEGVFSNVGFRTRLAKLLSEISQREREALFAKVPLFRSALIKAFGNEFTQE